ncbi:MAG: FAD-dependent monooxygenase [Spirochaetales bacterium]|nr:FAD-dependent monooxygenase [Spirochaetales bacterium]
MGYKEQELALPTDYSEEQLKRKIQKSNGISNFSYSIIKKSLDARKKDNILWRIKVIISSDSLKGKYSEPLSLEIPYEKRKEKVLVAGSGPAGFFSAYVLQKAGYEVTLIERGLDVDSRSTGIESFEAGGDFNSKANYAFGEGGAGTFSDGKLTSRTKSIKRERDFIFDSYIKAGAPEEISYLTHPHLGTDNLKLIVKNLRADFEAIGGRIVFDCRLTDIETVSGTVKSAETSRGRMDFDYLFIAPGHSSFETYRMLIKRGVEFRNKNFAIGSRVEHPQSIINLAQWGHAELAGVKAAEYRLTSQTDTDHPVYTFCMCPGGTVVPATAYEGNNIVNGMSLYGRDGEFANAACVAGVNIEQLTGHESSPLETLDWLEALERAFFGISPDYKAPAVSIKSFLAQEITSPLGKSSFPLGLTEYPIWEALPPSVSRAMRHGLQDFSRKIKGWDTGIIIGLESKTSAPVQVLRDETGLADGFDNLFIVGEGSGWAGGIISSAADGIRSAMSLI